MRIRNPNIQHLIERQIKTAFLIKREDLRREWRPPILISRERQSAAEEMAERLSERLGWPLYDKNIILEIAKEIKDDPKRVEFLDERYRAKFWEYVEAFSVSSKVLQEEYILYLKRFLRMLGRMGNCIIVGRGANFVIPPSKALRIRCVGSPPGWREILKRYYGLKDEEVERKVKEWNEEQRRFIEKFFGADINDPHHYDLILNLDYYPLERAMRVVLEAYREKFPEFNIIG
jgi:hypothetical protein